MQTEHYAYDRATGRDRRVARGIRRWRAARPTGAPTPRRSTPSWPSRSFRWSSRAPLTFAWRGAGRPRAPGALDPRRRRPRAVRARRAGHRPLAAAAAGRGRRAVRVQARRSAGTGGEDWIVDPLNPARAGDPVRRELGLPHLRLRAAGLERAARRARRADRGDRGRERAPSARRAASGSTCRRATTPARAYPLVVVHDGDDFVTYADLAGRRSTT